MSKRSITIDDLFRVTDCADMATSNDLDTVAIVTARPNPVKDTATRQLWLGDFQHGVARYDAEGDVYAVTVSGDGTRVAWCNVIGDKHALFVLNVNEERRQRFDLPDRCRALQLSPDGATVALTVDTPSDEGWTGHYYLYRTIRIKSDAEGYWDGKWAQMYLLPLTGPTVGVLQPIEHTAPGNSLWPSWSADGRRLAYVRSEPQNTQHMNAMSVWVYDVSAREKRPWFSGPGPVQHPVWSPDGSRIAYAGNDDPHGGFHTPWNIYVVDSEGERVNMTLGRQGVGDRMLGDVAASGGWEAGPFWTTAGIVYLGDRRRSSHVFRIGAPGDVVPLTESGQHVRSFAIAANGTRLLVLKSTPVRLPYIQRLQLSDGAASDAGVLPGADWNAELQQELALVEPERMTLTADDGSAVDAWVMRANVDSSGPAIVQIHGGPHASYGETFFHEFQWLVAAGYTIFYCNPRGSLGYPEEFIGEIVGAWGKVDADDILVGLEWLQKQPYVDQDAIGVAGGSYGGYMTNWLIGHTDAFRAAVTDRCLSNAVSFYGTSEIGPFFSNVAFAGSPWDNRDEYERASPLTYAPMMNTPLLIMHGTEDAQTPVEQGEQLYMALKSMDKDVELAIFPGANHEMSRAGKPSQRRERLQLMKAWFDKYMRQ